MFKDKPKDPKFGSKGKVGKVFLRLRRGKLQSCCKYGLLISLLWLFGHIYVSFYKSEIITDFQSGKINLAKIQQKLSDLVANRGNNPNLQVEKIIEEVKTKEEAGREPLVAPDDGITNEARNFMKGLGLVNPCENGLPVELPTNLSENIQSRVKAGYDEHGYNAFLSSMVSLNRHIPDVRSDVCKNKNYTNLPKCSIVIPFHNDDWMLLMRTVHSILNRSPLELIEEILLVDDASDKDYLQKPLDEYIKKYPKLRIVRAHRRLGIISNRMLGAVNAVGPIIVNVDSHVEVSPGWLEPILERFTLDMNVLVMPRVAAINKDTLKMWLDNEEPGGIGGFNWNMDFNWISYKWYEGDNPTPMWEPKRTPTIIGALHAFSKKFFMHVGMLDPDFDIWGGEDVELSFKVWLCGGKIEYVPCSFVGHMYKGHTYTFPGGKGGYRWNTDRIAEVWLDEYKRYYYRMVGHTKDRNYGDVSERIAIRKKIGCKPFKWLIENVYPMIPIPPEITDPPENTTQVTTQTTVTTKEASTIITTQTTAATMVANKTATPITTTQPPTTTESKRTTTAQQKTKAPKNITK